MIAGNGSGGAGWVQSGYIRWYRATQEHFFSQAAQYVSGTLNLNTVYGAYPSIGSTHSYSQVYSSSTGLISSKVDSTVFLTDSYAPATYWNYGTSVQYDAETTYLESDIAGNVASPVQYSSVQGQLQSTGSFASVPCTMLTHQNDGSATRTDGESWHDVISPSCPSFISYKDTAG